MSEKTFERVWSQKSFADTSETDRDRTVDLKLHIQPEAAFRVYDEFEENDILKNEDGSFTVTVSYPEDEWVYGYILSFGSDVEVVEPRSVRDIISKRLEETLHNYK